MDDERALQEVEAYLVLLNVSLKAFNTRNSPGYGATRDDILSGIDLIAKIGDRFIPGFGSSLSIGTTPGSWPFYSLRDRVLQLRGAVRDNRTATEILGPTGPRLAAADFHPIVWEAAARLWESGHPRQAVETAATAVDGWLRAKLGRSDIHGHALVGQAFTLEEPEPGKPRLRFLEIDPGDRDRWRDAHIGAMHFGMGCMMAIRNLTAHDPEDVDPQVALEQLAALSVLARRIDQATVVTT